ncbi:MAG: PAS domain S-box protein [Aphanothece sp. CMT-3BRIN-NPC111]|jgi:PAS domain S-box-containing protein|nr:PAS domain S-box protein [Aphanothece sp. CMT-3BRIN-NPC111]
MQLNNSLLGHKQDLELAKLVQQGTPELHAAMLMSPTSSYATLEQQAQQAELINRIVWAMRSTLVLDDILQTTVDQLHEALKVSRCLIFRPNLNNLIRASHVSETTDRGESLIRGTSDLYCYYHPTLVKGQSVVIPRIEPQLAPEIQESARVGGIRSILIVPLLYQQTYLGGISLYECDDEREWTAAELTFVQAIANHCAVAIHQAELYQQAQEKLAKTQQEEEILLQTTSDLQALFQAFPDLSFRLNSDGTILSCHLRGTDNLHVPPDVFLGKQLQYLLPPDVGRQLEARNITQRQQTEATLQKAKDELEIRVEERTTELKNANEQLHREVGERQRAEDVLKQSEEKFRNLVEQTNDWVWELDSNSVFTYVNPKVRDIVGYEPAEVLGKTIFDLMCLDEAKRVATVLEHFTSKQERFTNLETTLIHHNTNLVVLEISGSPVFDSQGVLQGYRGIARDITERKRVEREIRKALTKEKELSELKSRFVSMTSHEFRTPLTTILSSAELLEHYRHKWSDEKKLGYLHRIQAAVQQMTKLLDDVLIIGKAEAGKLNFNPVPLDLEKFCRDLVEELQLHEGKHHTIRFVTQGSSTSEIESEELPRSPILFCLDEKLLRHILNNLLSNAIKYSSQGNIVNFELTYLGEEVVFQIQDSGIGIPPKDQQRLFESFYRATNVGTISGTGLGLAIVKKSVDLHGGKIVVKSEVGSGTTFKVTLPLNYQQEHKTDEENFGN